uniref:Helicase C-terminal domain-containing protein n=1 Tax=Nothoprocta perdicaria TaxID=30464 RepID=A0A8C6ZZN3_NOTPE
HRRREPGHVLCFLASEQEISECCAAIETEAMALSPALGPLLVLPLHAGMGRAAQRVHEALEQQGRERTVVVTHWLADSSFSLGTVRFVIDAGLELRSVYNPRIRAESQVLRPISRSQADGRMQRAAGSPPGTCLRLYSEAFYEQRLPPNPAPHVSETSLSRLVLLLKRLDIADMGQCDFLDRPAPESLMQALEDLDYLAALDDDGNLSEVGIIMSEFPLDPQLAKALIASCEFDCVEEMVSLAQRPRRTREPVPAPRPSSAPRLALHRAPPRQLSPLLRTVMLCGSGCTVGQPHRVPAPYIIGSSRLQGPAKQLEQRTSPTLQGRHGAGQGGHWAATASLGPQACCRCCMQGGSLWQRQGHSRPQACRVPPFSPWCDTPLADPTWPRFHPAA